MSLTCHFCQTVEDFDVDMEDGPEEYIAEHIKAYACSSCRSAGKRIVYDDTIYVCPTCGYDCMVTREDEGIDGDAVECEGRCGGWYHASCALGYQAPESDDDEEVSWVCGNCRPASPEISSTRKPKKAKKTLPEREPAPEAAVDDDSKRVLLDSFDVPEELRPYFLKEKKVSASRDVDLRTKFPEVHAQLLMSGSDLGRLRKRIEQKQQQPVESPESARSRRREKRTQAKARALEESGGSRRGRKRRTTRSLKSRRGKAKSRRDRTPKKRRRSRRRRAASAESDYEDEDLLARVSHLEELTESLKIENDDLKVRMETLEEVGRKRERPGAEEEEEEEEEGGVNDPPAKKRRRVISRT